jgi:hypothetical protein
MKKTTFAIAIILVLSFSVLADDGEFPAGGKSCPSGQTSCLIAPPAGGEKTILKTPEGDEETVFAKVVGYLKRLFG